MVDDSWACVDDYALQEGDLVRDDSLYQRLSEANWQENVAELDGVAYWRVDLDRATGEDREQHYRWEYSRPWHYFRVSPIRWRVLDVQDGSALSLADRVLDCVPLNIVDEAVTWQDCTLRSWLNGYGAEVNRAGVDYTGTGLIDRAFTRKKRAAILTTRCENADNRSYGTDSGADTEDRLFILPNAQALDSEDAGRYGFEPGRDHDDPARRFTSTLYAKLMGAWWRAPRLELRRRRSSTGSSSARLLSSAGQDGTSPMPHLTACQRMREPCGLPRDDSADGPSVGLRSPVSALGSQVSCNSRVVLRRVDVGKHFPGKTAAAEIHISGPYA